MAAITVRNISDETHKALKLRAAKNGRSTEAEIRVILDNAVRAKDEIGLGSLLSAFAEKYDVELNFERDTEPARFVDFE